MLLKTITSDACNGINMLKDLRYEDQIYRISQLCESSYFPKFNFIGKTYEIL